MADETGRDAVAEAVRSINRAWLGSRFDELETFVHPDIVLATPGVGERVRGGETYVAGHRDFVEGATIFDFSEDEIEVDLVDDTAVATYRYEIEYEHAGQRYRSTGRDLYVFRRLEGRWIAVWRTMLDVADRAV